MRAGRLVRLMVILEKRGRVTAGDLAAELEVSERTVLRDIEALSGAGIPVYATRGPGGGFQLLEGHHVSLPQPDVWGPSGLHSTRPRRATILITPEGRQLATVLGLLQPLRVRGVGDRTPDEDLVIVEATFPIRSFDGTVLDILALSPHVEVLAPASLRDAVLGRLREALARYPPSEPS